MDDRWESEVMEYGAINITGFRIVDQERPMVKEFLKEWMHFDVTPQNDKRQSISVSATSPLSTFNLKHRHLLK